MLAGPTPSAEALAVSRNHLQFNVTITVWAAANMGATFKSPYTTLEGRTLRLPEIKNQRHLNTLRILYTLLIFLGCARSAFSDTNFAVRAEWAYKDAQKAFSTNSTNLTVALNYARTTFDRAEFSKNDDERESLAEIGIGAAHSAIRLDPNSAAAHYYLALNIGQLARTKMWGALKLIGEMERELKKAIEIDPKLDYAGAMRALSLLYMEAPGWPTSIDSKSKSRTLMERTLELAPTYPDNHLNYMEALAKWKDWKTFNERIPIYEALLPAAKKEFAAENWQDEWADWTPRWQAIQSKRK